MKIIPKMMFIPFLIKKPIWLGMTVPIVVSLPIVVDFISLCYVLFYMFIIDLVTGIFASYCEWKSTKTTDKWFFGTGKENGFSSKKAKGSALKALVYVGLPYLIIKFQMLLGLKNFKYERISNSEFELASLVVILFCLIEGFSIFHENLPKCGFNIWIRIKSMIGFYKQVKKEIND